MTCNRVWQLKNLPGFEEWFIRWATPNRKFKRLKAFSQPQLAALPVRRNAHDQMQREDQTSDDIKEYVKLTACERAMQIFLKNPNQSTREVARKAGCDHSLLSRDDKFQRLREACGAKLPKGTKSKEGRLEAEIEEEIEPDSG
jgi:hypothetical protein